MSITQSSPSSIANATHRQAGKFSACFNQPGAFQCIVLRALELPKAHREVFFLKEIQGHTLTEIAAILGISIDTARLRLKRARREIGHPGTSGAMGRAQ